MNRRAWMAAVTAALVLGLSGCVVSAEKITLGSGAQAENAPAERSLAQVARAQLEGSRTGSLDRVELTDKGKLTR